MVDLPYVARALAVPPSHVFVRVGISTGSAVSLHGLESESAKSTGYHLVEARRYLLAVTLCMRSRYVLICFVSFASKLIR